MRADEDPYEAVAAWMQEMGRRRPGGRPPDGGKTGGNGDVRMGKVRKRLALKELLLCAGLAAAFLQYYFIDVMVQVNATPRLVFFVPQQTGTG